MKRFALLGLLVLLLSACISNPVPTESSAEPAAAVPETTAAPEPTIPSTAPPETEATIPATAPPETETTATPAPGLELTAKEKTMLLKLGMAERGNCGCTECIALVMRTVLNRTESGRFGSSIRDVIFSEGQFTPVSDGSYYQAEPNALCRDALEMVIDGWDESQGALFYEWCEGESWHSRNLYLLFQHCDTRFYK